MSAIRKLIKTYLRKKGLTIGPLNGPALPAALQRLKAREAAVETVIDVGASNCSWSESLMAVYPNAAYLCVEAQSVHEPDLKRFTEKHRRAQYVLAAAGAETGEIYFDATDPFGGLASYQPVGKACIKVPVTTIDSEVQTLGLKPPFMIKLDTHGFEMPILAGATRTLAETSVLVIEVYNFHVAEKSLLFYEMCQHLAAKGFRCIDLFDVLYRPNDGALWQMDLMFMRADRPEFR